MKLVTAVIAAPIALVVTSPARGQDSFPTLQTLEARVRAGDSLDAPTLYRLAIRYQGARRYDEEEQALRTAIAADPRFAPSYALLGRLPYIRDKKLAKEERDSEVPPAQVPALDSALRLRLQAFVISPFGELQLTEGNPLPQDAVVLPEYRGYSGVTTYALGRVGIAAYLLARYDLSYSALDLYWSRRFGGAPDDSIPAWVLFYHGLACTQEAMYAKAEHDFQVLVDRNATVERTDSIVNIPLNGNADRYVLAVIKERDNKPADAIQLYQDIVSRDLGFYMAHVHLAQIYRKYRMWDKAGAEAQAAVDANPDDATLLVDLAAIDSGAGKLPDAALALKKAITVDPRYPEAYYQLGLVSQALAQPADARDAFTHFIAVAPSRDQLQVADARKRLDSLH